MKQLTIFLSIFLLIAGSNLIAADTVKIKLESPLVIGKTTLATGVFESLSSEAVSQGLDEARVKGTVSYKKMPDESTRVYIKWNALVKYDGQKETTQKLEGNFHSQFRTSDKSVEPGTTIAARGNMDDLASSADNLLQKSGNSLASSGSSATSGGQNGAPAPQVASNNATGSDSAAPAALPGDSGATMKVTTWEQCAPRVDRTAKMVYEQARKVVTTDTGQQLDRGSCEDHGDSGALNTIYGGSCQPLADYTSGTAEEGYMETATLNGKEVTVTNCTVDTLHPLTLQSDMNTCGVKNDFANGVTIQLQQHYFMDHQGTRQDIGPCMESTTTFKQFSTPDTCSPTVDNINNIVVPNERIAYIDLNGQTEYATACKPVSTTKLPIEKEYCAGQFQNDFNAGTSQPMGRHFYTFKSVKYYLDTTCGALPETLTQTYDTKNCPIQNDDAAQVSTYLQETYVTFQGQQVKVRDCTEYNKTNYVYSKKYWKSISSTRETFRSGGQLCMSPQTWNSDGAAVSKVFSVNVLSCTISGKESNATSDRTTWTAIHAWIRGDGTVYEQEIGTTYQNVAGGTTSQPAVP